MKNQKVKFFSKLRPKWMRMEKQVIIKKLTLKNNRKAFKS